MRQPTPFLRKCHVPLWWMLSICVLAVPVSAQESVDQRQKRREQDFAKENPKYEDFEQADKDFRKTQRLKFQELLTSNLSTTQIPKLKQGLRHHFYMLTNPKLSEFERQELTEGIDRMLAKAASRTKGAGQKKHRQAVLDASIEIIEKLMADQGYRIRFRLLAILTRMNIQDRPKQIPYFGTAKLLLKVATDENQYQDQRLLAFDGLRRILEVGNPPTDVQKQILTALAGELNKPGLQPEAYSPLAYLVGLVTQNVDSTGSPVGVMALLKTMDDPKRSWAARTLAARAVGNTGDGKAGLKAEPLAWKVAELTLQAAQEYNRQRRMRKGKPKDPISDGEMFNLFLSFTPEKEAERQAGQGLLWTEKATRSKSAIVLGAYKHLVKVTGEVVSNGEVTAKTLKDLEDWLKKNVPTDKVYHGSAPPIDTGNYGGQKKSSRANQGSAGSATSGNPSPRNP